MENKPLLSICIPTYNRAQYLKECLNIITSQFNDEDVYRSVEIVISDNASPDDTRELVAEYQKKFNNIRYFRNDENLLFDRNVDRAITEAKGEFCWTLSDDDHMRDGSLKFLLLILRKNPNVSFFCIDQKSLPDGRDMKHCRDGNEFLERFGLMGGLVSQNIFNKKFLPNDRRKYYDNYWIHFSLAKEISAKRPVILIKNIFEPQDYRVCEWAKDGYNLTTFIALKKIIHNLPGYGYEPDVINKLLKDFARSLPYVVASAKIYGLKIRFNRLKMLAWQFYEYPFWLFLSLAVFFTPAAVFKILKKIKQSL